MDSKRITVVTLTIWVTLVQGQPQYEVQVQEPIEFTYRSGQENRLADGRCCALVEGGTSCMISCNNQIILCLREMQHPTSDTNLANCPLGRMVFTPPTINTDIITFNATIGTTTTTYPSSFQLLYSIIVIPGGLEVESVRASLNLSIQNRTSPLTTLTFGAERIVLSTGGVRVVCKEGYFGPDCGCTPQDDSTGHFTCDEDGTIVCLPGYQNTATNCVEEEGATPEPTTDPETITTVAPTLTHSTTSEMSNTDTFTVDPCFENSADIVPIVAGGVAGGLVVLLLILIVNIVLVIIVVKVKYMKHYHSNKQESVDDEQIVMGVNPVYKIRSSNRPDDNNDSVYETVQ